MTAEISKAKKYPKGTPLGTQRAPYILGTNGILVADMRVSLCSMQGGSVRVTHAQRMPHHHGRPRPAVQDSDDRPGVAPARAARTRPSAVGDPSYALPGGAASSGLGLARADYGLFVKFFRGATPYIQGHRGRTFVIAIPGDVVDSPDLLDQLMEDVLVLHGLGVRLVLVVGARLKIDEAMRVAGSEPQYVRGYRVTDDVAMQAAVAAAGTARMMVEARLSKAPTVTQSWELRTTRNSRRPGTTTASGNYVAAKRKGVVDGIDYQHTGSVRFVQSEPVTQQLDHGNIVLLSNLGYSAFGEPLNCDCYSVAVRAAIDLSADKLVVVSPPDGDPFMETLTTNKTNNWLPVHEAERLLLGLGNISESSADSSVESEPQLWSEWGSWDGAVASGPSSALRSAHDDLDFDTWYELGLPMPLLAACMVCKSGVKRAHVINASIDGGLLLELYSTDGVGYMITSDHYEGIRAATAQDVSRIHALLQPMVEKGVIVERSHETIAAEIGHFTVLERDNMLLACAHVRSLGKSENSGLMVSELSAFCVHPDYRGSGKGDALLQYVEEKERAKASEAEARVMVLMTTRTADWFMQRGFKGDGAAFQSDVLPSARREEVDRRRNSQLYYKIL